MEPAFWHQRWQNGQIGFHMAAAHPLLVNQGKALLRNKARPPTVFVPLCGKTPDLCWLAESGCQVVGVELSAIAIADFFNTNWPHSPTIRHEGEFTVFESQSITLYQGDYFALTAAMLPRFDLCYDRAALIAMPPAMRPDYAQQLNRLTAEAEMLLITFEHDGDPNQGPPFPLTEAEIRRHYRNRQISLLASEPPADEERWRARGIYPVVERCYHLSASDPNVLYH